MSRAVEILTLQQFEAAGGLADDYAFEDFSCPLNEEIETFLREKAVQSTHLGTSGTMSATRPLTIRCSAS